ncbi:MAG: hypothetical protein KA371_13960 [Acidobacteria bacterium]|nr:hypothetical protein [Acidobacteriota bacterium]
MRVVLAAVLVIHGAIHLMGVAKAFGLAELPQLKQPISTPMGAVWGVAALLFLATAFGLYIWPRWWWAVAAAAVVVSTVAIVPSWSDAKVGAAANAAIALAAAVAFLLTGPTSQRAAYERDARAALAATAGGTGAAVTDDDLAALPAPVQRFLRVSGVVGHPRVIRFRARMHGRIRSGPDAGWMPIVAEQTNTVNPPVRLFYLDARMLGIPASGYHRFADGHATMAVKALGLVPVARDGGAAMTRSETVTFLNDLCLMAPAGLLTPAIRWEAVDDHRARATLTLGAHTVSGMLVFGADGGLADFWSDDRGRALPDGTVATGQRWSTPISSHRAFGPFTLTARGEARYAAEAGAYAYIELEFDDITYDLTPP